MNCDCPIVKLLEQHRYVNSEYIFPSKIMPLIANPEENICRKCGNIIYNTIDTICETCQELKLMLVNASETKVNTPLAEKDILSFPKESSKDKIPRKYHKRNSNGHHVGRPPSKNKLLSPKTPKSTKSLKAPIKTPSISPRRSKRQKRYREEPVETQEKNIIEWVKFEPPHKIRKTPIERGLKLCQICKRIDIIEVDCNNSEKNIDDGDFIWCFDCGRAFHTHCIYKGVNIKLNRKVDILRNSNWRCADCKYCEQCKEYEVDDPLIMCECCDRGFHISCLKPKLKKIPATEWICLFCILSDDRLIKEEVNHIEKEIMKLNCGICKDGNLNGCPWLLCRLCNKGIHKACDTQYLKSIGMKKIHKYLCPTCRNEREEVKEGKKEDRSNVNKEEKEEESFVL